MENNIQFKKITPAMKHYKGISLYNEEVNFKLLVNEFNTKDIIVNIESKRSQIINGFKIIKLEFFSDDKLFECFSDLIKFSPHINFVSTNIISANSSLSGASHLNIKSFDRKIVLEVNIDLTSILGQSVDNFIYFGNGNSNPFLLKIFNYISIYNFNEEKRKKLII